MSPAGPSWYDVLGVDPDATAEEIRAAWRAGIADLDPSDRRFRSLNQAAEVLLDEESRAAYDADLAEPASAPVPSTVEPDEQASVGGRAATSAARSGVGVWVVVTSARERSETAVAGGTECLRSSNS